MHSSWTVAHNVDVWESFVFLRFLLLARPYSLSCFATNVSAYARLVGPREGEVAREQRVLCVAGSLSDLWLPDTRTLLNRQRTLPFLWRLRNGSAGHRQYPQRP